MMESDASELPIFNPDTLNESTRGNRLVNGKVLNSYLRILKQNRSRLALALEGGNREQIGFIAHAMRSSSLSVGALRLGSLLGRLEHESDSMPGLFLEALVTQVLQVMDSVTDEVQVSLSLEEGGGAG